MKSIFLFCTKLKVYLIELPLIILFALAVAYNDGAKSLVKLYPLQAILLFGMIFIFIYFFRMIKINNEEIKNVGLFGRKERALINKDKRLVLTLRKRKKLLVELWGVDEPPALDWIDPAEYKDKEVNLFRGSVTSKNSSAKKILSYFGVDKNDFNYIFSNVDFSKEYELVSLCVECREENRTVSIKFKETL